MSLNVLRSKSDQSVNFVESANVGFMEARYVRRKPEYFISYLSSQTGCNRGCGFCHLTTTKQTAFEDVNVDGYLQQASRVFEHYVERTQAGDPKAKFLHYNFMARGEALANRHLIDQAPEILRGLGEMALQHELPARFNVSTILPLTLKKSLVDVFQYTQPTIYYSMYSVNEAFRKKWMPGAMPIKQAMELLTEYQKFTEKRLKIHYAFIEGANDSFTDVMEVVDVIHKYDLAVDFNIVRYNPGDDTSKEPSEKVIEGLASIIRSRIRGYVQVVSRVGFDVKASCGMFVDKEAV